MTRRGDRSIDRRGDDGAIVRRRARRVELHLCGGHLDTGSDWIGSHTRTFAFIGGAPAMVVSNNLRSEACFYEPVVNCDPGALSYCCRRYTVARSTPWVRATSVTASPGNFSLWELRDGLTGATLQRAARRGRCGGLSFR
jgi:hypothetical protein